MIRVQKRLPVGAGWRGGGTYRNLLVHQSQTSMLNCCLILYLDVYRLRYINGGSENG